MTKTRWSVRDMCYIAIFVALTAVMAQISIPMPLGVPMTMQTFAICLSGMLLGSKKGAVAAFVYLLIGMAGVPVFSSFRGGMQMLVGPTGGFLLSFPVMAFLIGLGVECGGRMSIICGMLLGNAFNYLAGMAMYSAISGHSLWTAFVACVVPFIPTAIMKAVAAAVLGTKLRARGVAA